MSRNQKVDWETAVAVAQEQLRCHMENPSLLNELLAESTRHFVVTGENGPEYSERVLELEREVEQHSGDLSSRRTHDEVMRCVQGMLREGVKLPPALSNFTADMLEGKRHSPPRTESKGKPQINPQRDWAIVLAVRHLHTVYEMPAYSNNPAEPENYQSACGAVAETAYREKLTSEVRENMVKRQWKMKKNFN